MRKLLWIAVVAMCASCTCNRSLQEDVETDSIEAADVVVAEEAEEVASNTNVHNGHEYVDLGLPSGNLWATCNVGADKPEGYGDYYAWGETDVKSYCDQDNYFDKGWKKYNENSTSLGIEDDVAHVKWGGNWRMPTQNEFIELIRECTWVWNKEKKGYDVKSKTNAKAIFLPAAGSRSMEDEEVGSLGSYWTVRPLLVG